MTRKLVYADEMEMNYKFSCRCCLKSEAEFFNLDYLTDGVIGDSENVTHTKIPLMRLLLFCIRTENVPELPQYICKECSKSLQIAYFFIQNSLRAHEILCRKLCPGKLKTTTRFNGQKVIEPNRDDTTVEKKVVKPKPVRAAVRHECKVCGAIIYDRMELKTHIRKHTMAARHPCKLCKFVTLKQHQLPEHYRKVHNLTALQIDQQLKIQRSVQAAVAAAAVTTTTKSAPIVDDSEQIKVCTLEDMELLIPMVLKPEDFTHPQLDADQLRDIEQQLVDSLNVDQPVSDLNSSLMPAEPTIPPESRGNMSIGTEFLVMPDGSLQQVSDGGVVFEYIDDSKSKLATSNMSLQNLLEDSKSEVSCTAMDMDVNHLLDNVVPQITAKPPPRPGPGSIAALKHKCKQCPKAFPTVARLKSHQLTHSHLPKFYCDQCSYYSLRSSDLIQHQVEEHNVSIDDNSIQLEKSSLALATDRSRLYCCDMCLYEAPTSFQLQKHYSEKHLIRPNEVQLRPSWINESKDRVAGISTLVGNSQKSPNIPLGITYPLKSSAVAAAEAMAEINESVQLHPPPQATTTAVVTPAGDLNVVVDATSLFYAASAAAAAEEAAVTTSTASIPTQLKQFSMFPEQSFATTTTTMNEVSSGLLPADNVAAAGIAAVPTVAAVASTENPNANIFGDMRDFIDDTDVAAICTIPADDMPVVDGDDIVIENNMSLDFDAENLFEDFEEDVEVGEEDDDDEDAENDDENDNNDAATDQNLLLTSDDDDVDDFDDEQSKHLQKPYCIYCNKKFTSQYKFENHMFVHRGLAPYRCELCTNLYNMKRLLIRHYKTVHKRMPTRDMVQAKGDKILVESTAIEKLNHNADKPPMLMCAKCPFECEHDEDMRKHLNAHHGINDGVSMHANEVFIIRKLPYECPRCIRSFAAKRTLIRHLQRSHLVDTIIEMQTNSSTATSTTPKNANASDGNKAPDVAQESNMMDGNDDNMECEDNLVNNDTGLSTDDGGTVAKSLITASTPKVMTKSEAAAASFDGSSLTTAVAAPAAYSTLTTTTIDETATTTAIETTLFPTPTPFDFDLDFIGNGTHNTSLKTNNDNFNVIPSPRQILNGSDKLLTAALEPSPIKDLRPRLPRTPIFVCKQCNQTFDELDKLVQHEFQQHSSDTVSPQSTYQHQCDICSTSYRTATLLNYHMKRHATRKAQCKQCSMEFVSHAEMELHVVAEHGARIPLKCGINGCNKTFNYKHHLKRHQTASHTPVQYICPECGVHLMSSLLLRAHMYTHKSPHTYKCPKCVRTYMRRNAFRKHVQREHDWDATDEEINKTYFLNDITSRTKDKGRHDDMRELRSLKVEYEQSEQSFDASS